MKARRKFRQSKSHAIPWIALIIVLALGFVAYRGVTSIVAIYNSWIADLPAINSDAFNFAEESTMYASDGTTLLANFQLEKREPVELKDVSKYVTDGTVAVEDVRYYEHNGVDPQGIIRAVINNLKGGQLEGASTITQQLVRNTTLSEEATNITLERKAREAELALELEKQYSKEEILNMYLNTINYGDGCYGIEAAANNYFQKTSKDLTLAEAAALVGIPQSPTRFNPKENPEACVERRNLVLERMLAAGNITKDEYDKAVAEELVLDPAPDEPAQGIHAYPYFTSYVRDQLMQPDNIYGCSYADLFEGGLKIYTTLDVSLQDKANDACAAQYDAMEDGLDCALVAMDPTNGYVKAIVGGKDFYTDQWNIATQGGRPAGSSFKVFTLAAAIEQGISPKTSLNCGDPLTLSNGLQIHNFDSINYGTRSLESATRVSSNTGYYRLADRIGADSISEMAHRLGVTSELAPYTIITLGTENVTPLEMADAYSTLATGGIHRDAVVITRIENKNGEVLYENADTGERVLDEKVAGAVTTVLRGVFESGEGTAYGSGPSNGQPVAGKTGTGQEFRDHWLVGYSPDLTCAVWIGNRDYSSTSPSLTANSLWHNFMSAALADVPVKNFEYTDSPTYTNTNEQMYDNSYNYNYNYSYDNQNNNQNNNQNRNGTMTEDDLESEYGNYEIVRSYQESGDYADGTVVDQTVDEENGVVYVTITQDDGSGSNGYDDGSYDGGYDGGDGSYDNGGDM